MNFVARLVRKGRREVARSVFQSQKLKTWTEKFFLTRFFVQIQAREAFDLMAGFVYSQVLLICIRLEVLKFLADGPKQIVELSDFLDLSKDRFDCLIGSACALGLLEEDGLGNIDLGIKGQIFAYDLGLCALIKHHELFYGDLVDPVGLFKDEGYETSLNRYWGYAKQQGNSNTGSQEEKKLNAKKYSDLMSLSQPLVTEQIFQSFNFDKYSSILDVGGGKGTFAIRLAEVFKGEKIASLDLPDVCIEANKSISRAGVEGKVTAIPLDFFKDPVPVGYELITLIRVLYDHPTEDVLRLLVNVRKALPKNGAVLIAEPMETNQITNKAKSDAYFWLYLAAMGKGRPRTSSELESLLLKAGFSRSRCLKTTLPIQTGIVVGKV